MTIAYGHDKPFACIDQESRSPYKIISMSGFWLIRSTIHINLDFVSLQIVRQNRVRFSFFLTRDKPVPILTVLSQITGPNGELYVICNSDSGILFNKSMDGWKYLMNAPLNIDSSSSRIQTIPESFYTNATGSLIPGCL